MMGQWENANCKKRAFFKQKKIELYLCLGSKISNFIKIIEINLNKKINFKSDSERTFYQDKRLFRLSVYLHVFESSNQ